MNRRYITIGIAVLVVLGLVVWYVKSSNGPDNTGTYSDSTASSSSDAGTASSEPCSVFDCPNDLYASDNGKTFTYTETSRFAVHLDEATNPKEHLKCTPSGVIGPAAGTPSTIQAEYSASYEAIAEGTCSLTTDNFQATIKVMKLVQSS